MHTVTALHITDTDRDFVDVTISTSGGPEKITSTAHHLWWDVTTHSWTDAAKLSPGDLLDTPGNGHATIESLNRYTSSFRTYNLTIDTTHTYYVLAGNAPVLVHNCGSGGPEGDTTSMGGRGNPFRGGAPNVAAEIGGRTYTGHALDRMQQQGIVPAVVEDAISGSAIPGKSAGTVAHYSESNRLTVITDAESGRVITVDYGKI